MRKHTAKTVTAALLMFGIGCSAMSVRGEYRNTDARYLRDNIEYFTGQKENAGFGKKVLTHGVFAVPYPQAAAMYKLYTEENEWVESYVASRLIIMDQTGSGYSDNRETSPYEALSRLVIDTNSEEMKAYYALFELDESQLSDKTEVSEAEIDAWQTARKEYVYSARHAWQLVFADQLYDYMKCAISFLPFILFSLVRFIRFILHTIRSKHVKCSK